MIQKNEKADKAQACLIMGAIGDALGAPIEFMSTKQIVHKFGERGLCNYAEAYGHKGPVTDDTQMTLMVADGLLAVNRGADKVTYRASIILSYLRWLETQGRINNNVGDIKYQGNNELFDLIKSQGPRAPGNTCISALMSLSDSLEDAQNYSKGCGTVMRVAPIGLYFGSDTTIASDRVLRRVYDEAMSDASITHGHQTAQHSSGVLAVIIALSIQGKSLIDSIEMSLELFGTNDIKGLCEKAVTLSIGSPSLENLESIGQGWVAEEALAMSLYCALEFARGNCSSKEALLLAVNHSGDSDSTGAITGNLIGVAYGSSAIPADLLGQETEVDQMLPILKHYGSALAETSNN